MASSKKATTTPRKSRTAKAKADQPARMHKDGYWFQYRRDEHGRRIRDAYDSAEAHEPCETLIMSDEHIQADTDAQQAFHH